MFEKYNWRTRREIYMGIWSFCLGVVGAIGALMFIWLLQLCSELFIVGIGHFDETQPLTFPFLMPLYWVPVVTTLGGLISGVIVYRLAPEAEGHGTDAYIDAFHQHDGAIRSRVPWVKALASAITIGSGGSAGREGPTAQICAGIAAILADRFRLANAERRLLTVVATAAGLSAIFKSPLGSALFAVKVLYSGFSMETRALYFAILASATAYTIMGFVVGWSPIFNIQAALSLTHPMELSWYVGLGIASGIVASIIPTIFYKIRDLFRLINIPRFIKPAVGGLLLGLIAMWIPQILGGGYQWIELAINHQLSLTVLLILLLLKPLAMALTIGSGGSGGIFAPTLFIGAMLGALFAELAGAVDSFSPSYASCVIIGMLALFGAAARTPLASLVMIMEMTGEYGLVAPAAVTVVISALVQRTLTGSLKYPTLYESQVAMSIDSPAIRREYISQMVALADPKGLDLPPTLLVDESIRHLSNGQTISLPDGRLMRAYSLTNTTSKDGLLALLQQDHVLLLSIIRNGINMIPGDGVSPEEGDLVIVVGLQTRLPASLTSNPEAV